LPPQFSHTMKISLFTKTYITKPCSILVLFSLLAGMPIEAHAGFFDFIKGTNLQAQETDINNEFGPYDFNSNSQNIPLLETSINPDMKKAADNLGVIIAEDGVLLPDVGLVGSGIENISSGEMFVYEVKEGDTLSEIAELYDVSINTIRWENNITGQNIRIGQKLNILPVTGVKHTVKKGDTLDKIASRYEAEVEDIMVFNDILKKDVLKEGRILYVPNGIIKPVVVAQKPSSSTPTYSSNTKIESGYYVRPAVGRITSNYGPRKGGFHYGVDIGNSRGTPVSAAASGKVIKVVSYCVEGRASCGGRYGNYIVIEHPNGTKTIYAHLSKVYVSVGQQVSQRENIGTIGNTGRSTGPHLHFEIENANGSKMRPQI